MFDSRTSIPMMPHRRSHPLVDEVNPDCQPSVSRLNNRGPSLKISS